MPFPLSSQASLSWLVRDLPTQAARRGFLAERVGFPTGGPWAQGFCPHTPPPGRTGSLRLGSNSALPLDRQCPPMCLSVSGCEMGASESSPLPDQAWSPETPVPRVSLNSALCGVRRGVPQLFGTLPVLQPLRGGLSNHGFQTPGVSTRVVGGGLGRGSGFRFLASHISLCGPGQPGSSLWASVYTPTPCRPPASLQGPCHYAVSTLCSTVSQVPTLCWYTVGAQYILST